MANKAKGVMAALKGRKGLGSKKGVALMGLVAKLTAKRKAAKGDSESAVEDKGEIGSEPMV